MQRTHKVTFVIYKSCPATLQNAAGLCYDQGTGDRAQGTGHRGQGTGDRAQGTGHRAQGTGHRGQNGYFSSVVILSEAKDLSLWVYLIFRNRILRCAQNDIYAVVT